MCDGCRGSRRSGARPICCVCGNTADIPLLKAVQGGQFVHPVCYRALPGAAWSIRDQPLSCAPLEAAVSAGTCSVCQRSCGVTLACNARTAGSEGACGRPFHLLCVLASGVLPTFRDPAREIPPIVPLCAEHSELPAGAHGSDSGSLSALPRRAKVRQALKGRARRHPLHPIVANGGPLAHAVRPGASQKEAHKAVFVEAPTRVGAIPPLWPALEWSVLTSCTFLLREWKVQLRGTVSLPQEVRAAEKLKIAMINLADFLRIGLARGFVRVGTMCPTEGRFAPFAQSVGAACAVPEAVAAAFDEEIVGFCSLVGEYHVYFVRCGSAAQTVCPDMFSLLSCGKAPVAPEQLAGVAAFAVFLQLFLRPPTLPFQACCPRVPRLRLDRACRPPPVKRPLLRYVEDLHAPESWYSLRVQSERVLTEMSRSRYRAVFDASEWPAVQRLKPVVPPAYMSNALAGKYLPVGERYVYLLDDGAGVDLPSPWRTRPNINCDIILVQERRFRAFASGREKFPIDSHGQAVNIGELFSRSFQRRLAAELSVPCLAVYDAPADAVAFLDFAPWMLKESTSKQVFSELVAHTFVTANPQTSVRVPLAFSNPDVLLVAASDGDVRCREGEFESLSSSVAHVLRKRLVLVDIGPNLAHLRHVLSVRVPLVETDQPALPAHEIPVVLPLPRVEFGEGLPARAMRPAPRHDLPVPFADALAVVEYLFAHRAIQASCCVVVTPHRGADALCGAAHLFTKVPRAKEILHAITALLGKPK